jgi:Fe-S-cluster-containing hydrogenase component 2
MFSLDQDLFFTESENPVYTIEMDREAVESACMHCTNCMDLCHKLGAETVNVSTENGAELRKCVSDGMCLMACPSRQVFKRGGRIQETSGY